MARTADPRRHTALHPWVTNEAYDALAQQAAARGQQVDRFAAALLELIAIDNMFDAILDTEQPDDARPRKR
jgi:hypothetical protein